MSRDRIQAAAGFIKGTVMCLIGRRPESVENLTDYRLTLDSVEEDSDLQPRAKRQREERSPLVVSPMIGKGNLENLETVLDWVKNDKVYKIGIFGMGGCGKTTLAMHVYNRLLESDIFPSPVWVTVGMDFNSDRLQEHISSAVGLDLEYEKDENRRAARLHNFLSRRGRYLLILDDVWEPHPLKKLGIPMLEACKVIITTRTLNVCGGLGCQKIKIGMLEVDEAWDLFCSKVGHDALAADEMRHIGKLVCHECRGLPLAITALASSLSGLNDLSQWKFTLQELRGFSIKHDLLKCSHLFQKLLLSYNRLMNTKVKLCFLYSALYPVDYDVQKEELIRLWIAEGLIDEVPSLQMQYDKGHTIMNNLVDYCLLESSEDGRCVKMHNMIREMAVRITRQKSSAMFLARPGAQLKSLPEASEFKEDLHAVSLVRNSISDIPSGISPNCTRLSILLLQHNPLEGVPGSFFLHMCSLRVLDLSDTSITRLPESVCNLENLRSLLLHCCEKLIHVPSLANLKALQILDLGHSGIGQVPSSMKELIMLRELDLSGFSKLKVLDQGILSMLPSLKRISCYVVGVLQELQNLRSLEILDATFHSISDFNSYVSSEHWRVLDSFRLQVGDAIDRSDRAMSRYSNIVSLCGCSFASERDQRLVLPDNLLELYVDKCKGLDNIFYILSDGRDLKDTSISKDVNCINAEGCNLKCSYWSLDHTSLNSPGYHLDGVKKGGGLLSKLETWTISRCHDIEKLFTRMQIVSLQNLQVMKIRDCIELKELITDEVGDRCQSECDDHAIRFPKLKMLELTQLPMLSNICRGLLLCSSLQSIRVVDCPKLTQLPFSFFIDDQHKSLLPTLEQIEGQGEWWDSLELKTETKSLLQTVFRQIFRTLCFESGGDTVSNDWP